MKPWNVMWVHISACAWGACLFGPHFSACSAFGFPHKQEVSWNSTSLTKKTEMYRTLLSPLNFSLFITKSGTARGAGITFINGTDCFLPSWKTLYSRAPQWLFWKNEERHGNTLSREEPHLGVAAWLLTPQSTEHRVKSSGVEHTAGTDMGIWLDRNVSENLVEEASIHPECQPVFSVPQETTVFPLG